MTLTAHDFLPSIDTEPNAARVSFRQPVSTEGFVDAAWWPRSRDLAAELPGLLEVLWTSGREIARVTYNIGAWEPVARRLRIRGHMVRLGGFNTSDADSVRLSDVWARERIDVLVIPPATDPAMAERVLQLAGEVDSTYRADEILRLAADPAA